MTRKEPGPDGTFPVALSNSSLDTPLTSVGAARQSVLTGCRGCHTFAPNVSTLSEVTRRSELEDDATVDRRVSFDRAV